SPRRWRRWVFAFYLFRQRISQLSANVDSVELSLSDFKPTPKLVTHETPISQPRFPVIDFHNHLRGHFGGWETRPVSQLLDILDEADVRLYIDLDGGWGEDIVETHLDHFKAAAPERFRVYGGVDWDRWTEHGDKFGEWAADRLRKQAARGVEGLKNLTVVGLAGHGPEWTL